MALTVRELPVQTGPYDTNAGNSKITLHIEVRLFPRVVVAPESTARCVHHWLSSNFTSLQVGQDVTTYSVLIQSHRRMTELTCIVAKLRNPIDLVSCSVEAIRVVEVDGSSEEIMSLHSVELKIHTYQIYSSAPSGWLVGGDHGEEQPNARVFDLPSAQLDDSWEQYALGSFLF